jgi:signal transduction histidine kinase
MIDVLGLSFTWYSAPYCAILVAVGVVLIEAKSVLENYHKSKSAARQLPDILGQIIEAATDEDAKKILEIVKSNDNKGKRE